jgi:hypothetical protein
VSFDAAHRKTQHSDAVGRGDGRAEGDFCSEDERAVGTEIY